jgi:hypothetical protein
VLEPTRRQPLYTLRRSTPARFFPSWLAASCQIAVALLFAIPSQAQQGGAGPRAGEGDCMPSRGAHECALRCPSFDLCTVKRANGAIDYLYYRVDSERFDCSGLDCTAATQSLGDYCCRRGEFAPPRGDAAAAGGDDGGSGGCSLAAGRGRRASSDWAWPSWACLGIGVGTTLARRRRAGTH